MVQVGRFFQIVLAFPEYMNFIMNSFLRYTAVQNHPYSISRIILFTKDCKFREYQNSKAETYLRFHIGYELILTLEMKKNNNDISRMTVIPVIFSSSPNLFKEICTYGKFSLFLFLRHA